jgi:hypothetical protein
MLWTDSNAFAENPQSLAIARLLGYSGHVRADTLGGNADEAPETALDVFWDRRKPMTRKQPQLEPRKDICHE